tara:strand:- start:110 stop:715 length:606 start_codon:yes stop_codon:yes gene_type:complete
MFSGIIQEVGIVKKISTKNNVQKIQIKCTKGFLENLDIGNSVSVDGVCLTIVKLAEGMLFFDVIEETISRSIITEYQIGTKVNLENSLKYGESVGGHLCSGHVHTKGVIKEVELNGDSKSMLIELDQKWSKYVLEKGYISVNGCSLTIGKVSGNSFNLHLIPETLRATNLNDLIFGGFINIEIDQNTIAIVDTTERLTRSN